MISSGTRFGPYEIETRLGAGGMGEVYRAYDTRLGRQVAIKVLSGHTGDDPSVRKRFLREARAISSITHPNICALFDIGSENGSDYLVMELLEGRTLAEELANGALAPDDALARATEIAAALEHAHRKGIVHRDLKPGNIILTKTGAKLLDFGLARLLNSTDSSIAPLTADNAIIGTIEYMAPEQLNGDVVDARADIFSFGVVLYEMLTGKRPFGGGTRASLIGSILFSPPQPINAHVADAPAGIEKLLQACLQKDPDERVQTAHDLHLQLRWMREGAFPVSEVVARKRKQRGVSALAVTAAVLTALATGAVVHRFATATPQRRIHFAITPRAGQEFQWTAVSPDGGKIAYLASDRTGRNALWVRELDADSARELPGTRGAMTPFWSPDSTALAFFADMKLSVIELEAKAPRAVCEVSSPRGGSWSANGTILFTPHIAQELFAVPAGGGEPKRVTVRSKDDTTHRWPEFLPDGNAFLFVISSRAPGRSGLYLSDLTSKRLTKIANTEYRAIAVGEENLLYIDNKRLLVRKFDDRRGTLADRPRLVAENVEMDPNITGSAAFSAPSPNILSYVTKAQRHTRLVWCDLAGNEIEQVAPFGQWTNPNLSPDGRKLAVAKIDDDSGKYSLWQFDLSAKTSTRLTVDDNNADAPIWSHDGSRVYFSSDRRGRYALFEKVVDSSTSAERIVYEPSGSPFVAAASARKAGMLLFTTGAGSNSEVWFWPAGGQMRPVPSPSNEGAIDLSPDGKWLAYQRLDLGTSTFDVFVMSMENPELKIQISQGGAGQTTWSADGRKLYFVRPDKKLMVVDFRDGRASVPRPLFTLDVSREFHANRDYVPSADDTRVLVAKPHENAAPAELRVVLNWLQE